MMVEVESLYHVEVFTHKGKYLGKVYDVLLDIRNNKIYELVLYDTNNELVEGSRNVGVPYRWVKSITDVIILKYFPGRIRVKPRSDRAWRKHKMRVLKRKPDHGISREPWR